ADLVEAGGKGDQAVAADASVGGFDADDAGLGGGHADASTGVGAECGGAEICGYGCGGASGGAAGCGVGDARVFDDTEKRGGAERAHREFVEGGFADQDGAGGFEAFDDGGVVGRNEVLEHAAAGGGAQIAHADVVFDRDGNAGQCAGEAAVVGVGLAGSVDVFGLLQEFFGAGDGDERVVIGGFGDGCQRVGG